MKLFRTSLALAFIGFPLLASLDADAATIEEEAALLTQLECAQVNLGTTVFKSTVIGSLWLFAPTGTADELQMMSASYTWENGTCIATMNEELANNLIKYQAEFNTAGAQALQYLAEEIKKNSN